MSPHIRKSHSVSELVYHLVCPVKYRRKIFTKDNHDTLKTLCVELSKRHEIYFLEVGIDTDHVHFLIQSIPNLSPSDIANTVKGNISFQFFKLHPEIKKRLWGGNLWTSGYYANTVGQYGNLDILKNYVQNQGYENYESLLNTQGQLFPL